MVQQNYEELQMLDYQVKQIQKMLETVDQQLAEVLHTKDALEEFKKTKIDDEVLFPLASGIFVKGKLADNKIVQINVGSNAVVEKTIDEAVLMMDHQQSEISDYKKQLIGQLEKFMKKAEEIEDGLRSHQSDDGE